MSDAASVEQAMGDAWEDAHGDDDGPDFGLADRVLERSIEAHYDSTGHYPDDDEQIETYHDRLGEVAGADVELCGYTPFGDRGECIEPIGHRGSHRLGPVPSEHDRLIAAVALALDALIAYERDVLFGGRP